MRLIFTTKFGAKNFWRLGTTGLCSFVRKSMYRYGFHAKRFADLEVSPKILRVFFGGGSRLDRWESDHEMIQDEIPSLKLTCPAPENRPSQKESSLPTIHFQRL